MDVDRERREIDLHSGDGIDSGLVVNHGGEGDRFEATVNRDDAEIDSNSEERDFPDKTHFLDANHNTIHAIVGNATAGADAKLIDNLPKLEILSSFSVGKIFS
ncbi:hypothetical protein LWI28_005446 [Acer negundo]|uniref:Uncharacterized protein n=1 Tax=Acer negundo TaxID=4023 RepID=A0AAD5P268_ACENE|nr:hypothetical protein LWI28_005446 [Acer negundo]